MTKSKNRRKGKTLKQMSKMKHKAKLRQQEALKLEAHKYNKAVEKMLAERAELKKKQIEEVKQREVLNIKESIQSGQLRPQEALTKDIINASESSDTGSILLKDIIHPNFKSALLASPAAIYADSVVNATSEIEDVWPGKESDVTEFYLLDNNVMLGIRIVNSEVTFPVFNTNN